MIKLTIFVILWIEYSQGVYTESLGKSCRKARLFRHSSYEIEQVTEPSQLSEGLHWDEEKQTLYFTDITASTINAYNPKTCQHTFTKVDGEGLLGFVIPVKGRDHSFVVGTGREIRLIEWDEKQDSKLSHNEVIVTAKQEPGSRFNDAKVDNFGNLWAGTMGPEPVPTKVQHVNSHLFSFNINKSPELVPQLDNIYISNGLAWSNDNKHMYYTDTGNNSIDQYDYDPETCALTNPKEVYNFTTHQVNGKTDGFTIDTEGNLYLACYGGYQVIVVNPNTGRIVDKILVPALEVTTTAFGGPNLSDLYIASSRKGATQGNLQEYPSTGAVYRIKNYKAKGFPGNPMPIENLIKAK